MNKSVFIFLVYVTLLSSVALGQSVDLAKGLVSYVAFNGSLENKLVLKQEIIGKQIEWTSNRFGETEMAFNFNGNEGEIVVPTTETFPFVEGADYTISFWIKPLDENSGCLILKEGDFGIKWNGINKPLTVFDGLKGGFRDGDFDNWSSNNWYHITLVRNNSNLTLYVNGKEDESWQAMSKTDISPKNIHLGKHPYFWGSFSGKFDDLVIYDRPLNEYEVQTLGQIEHIPVEETAELIPLPELSKFIGNWQGVLTQPNNPGVPNYPFWLFLNKKEKGKLTGYTRIEVPEDNSYGVAKSQAFISGNSLNFEEIQVLRQKNYLGYKWCKKFGQFRYDPEQEILKGKWYADNCEIGGEILLFRTDKRFNYHDNRLTVSVKLEELVEKLKNKAPTEDVAEEVLQLDLEPIRFNKNSYVLTQTAKSYLTSKLVPVLIEYKNIKLTITGHTDNLGEDQYNLRLSQMRAKIIADFLQKNNIEAERLAYEGYGESVPVNSNDTADGRAKNRRVEFILSL